MALLERIEEDFKQALLQKRKEELTVLRGLKSALHNKEIELKSLKKEMTEEVIIEIVQKEAKKRREASEMYIKGERQELAEKEEKELIILNKYLPEQFSDDKIKEIVNEVIQAVNPVGPQDFGKIMGKVMVKAKGKVQGDQVKKIVQDQISQL